jgi:hypothetical protein
MKILYIWFTPDRKEALIYVIIRKYYLNENKILTNINKYVLNYYFGYLGLSIEEAHKHLPYWPISNLDIEFSCYWHTLDYEIGFIHEFLPFDNNLTDYQIAINDNNPDWYSDLSVIPKPTFLVVHIRNKTIDNNSPFLDR